jgi:4-diphosphocytidyl-2-C-methyl-D-erythritol kinase
MTSRRIEVSAPAKINLSLGVGSKRPDGYHPTYSVMQAIGLMDEITIEISEENSGISIFSADEAMPKDDTNLAVKAAKLMLSEGLDTPCLPEADDACAISITIDKKIPMAAGLAGGSADAAAVMLGLAADGLGSRAEYTLDDLISIGVSLGADVPFSIASAAMANPHLGYADHKLAKGVLEAQGIGEILSPLGYELQKASVVLIKPPISVPTPLIFKLLDENSAWIPRPENVGAFTNTLEYVTPNEFPVVAEILAWLRSNFKDAVIMMSGSGPTCFAYIAHESGSPERSKEYAEEIYDKAKEEFPDFEIFSTETI